MNRSQQKYSKKHSAGFSLIEFLVASVLSMIVLIAIGSGYFAARKINDVALGRLGVQQDMRNAANLIVRDARMAGSFGCFNMANKEPATVGSDGSASSNTPRNLIAAGQTTGLVPVKSFAGSTFNVTGFTASGDALVFQYGIGSASITGNMLTTSGTTIKEDMAMLKELGLTNQDNATTDRTGTCGSH